MGQIGFDVEDLKLINVIDKLSRGLADRVNESINGILESLLGFPVTKDTNKAKVLGAIQRNKIEIKHFKFTGKDKDKTGWYIFERDVLMGFLGEPFLKDGKLHITVRKREGV